MNDHALTKLSATLLFFFAVLGICSTAIAADSERHQRVDKADFYLAVIPAEITQGLSGSLPGFKKHETRYHIIVSIFDSRTANRITDAEIQASVSAPGGMAGQHKKLDPMLIMDAASYGNYFIMSDPGKYSLRFKVKSPSRKYETTAEFFFDRSKD